MMLDSAEKWIIAFAFGAVMVGMYSWSRFDEPSCDSQSEYFFRYKPQFSTSYGRYARAKWAYVGAMMVVYMAFSLVPGLVNAFASLRASDDSSKTIDGFPLAVALALVTLQNVPGLKELEKRVRRFLHTVARIPDCVRRTVAQMRSSPFNFEPGVYQCQTKKLLAQPGTASPLTGDLSKLRDDDEILHTWYCVGNVLAALSERRRDGVGIDPIFFANYRDELDSIAAKHIALVELVRERVGECLKGSSPTDLGTLSEVRDLRDRLYTFVACGVHSTVRNEADSLDVVARLGFVIADEPGRGQGHAIGPLAACHSSPLRCCRHLPAIQPRRSASLSWSGSAVTGFPGLASRRVRLDFLRGRGSRPHSISPRFLARSRFETRELRDANGSISTI